jgi:CheY-like chemotaxis protein
MSNETEQPANTRQPTRLAEQQHQQIEDLIALGKLAKPVAHDFNNILAAVLMNVELIQMNPGVPPEIMGSLQAIELELHKAVGLTRQLLMRPSLCAQQPPSQPFHKTTSSASPSASPRTTWPEKARQSETIRDDLGNILLVEDDPSLRRTTALCLRKLGYAVFEAQDASEALGIWNQRKQTIQLLLADMTLPGVMTGLDLAQQLRNENPKLTVIISTGYDAEASVRSSALPNAAMLQKPYGPSALAAVVRQSQASRPI